jgi:hypothetical protein
MSTFIKGGSTTTPFGKREYLRSTRGNKYESYTVAASTVPAKTIDGNTEKILQPGTVMAKITSGGETGKVGPFQAGVADGRQTVANIVGLNDTFLPWQLIERDVEIAVMYIGTAVQGWCVELDAGGLEITLTNTTADAMRSTKGLDVTFK